MRPSVAIAPAFRAAKKNPGQGPGLEAFLLSHIKAPAQGGKAGSSELPGANLANQPWAFKGKGQSLRCKKLTSR
jgi:hypothetical protein